MQLNNLEYLFIALNLVGESSNEWQLNKLNRGS